MKAELLVDLESQRTLLAHINSKLKQQNQALEIENRVLQKLARPHKNSSTVVTIFGLSIISLLAFTMYFSHMPFYAKNADLINSKYVIENLQGDTVDTWLHWNLVQGRTIGVNILNTDTISQEKLDAIKAVILSNDSILLDDSLVHKGLPGSTSTYYTGWSGALKQASKTPTKYYIPTEFVILESAKGEGDITIDLVTYKDSDGYSGYTKSVTEQQQILKSHITIYDVDSLSAEQIGTILRHEFGHALGLAHSTAPEDLMAPVISTPYPYISECDIAAISALYDGNESSQVICEK